MNRRLTLSMAAVSRCTLLRLPAILSIVADMVLRTVDHEVFLGQAPTSSCKELPWLSKYLHHEYFPDAPLPHLRCGAACSAVDVACSDGFFRAPARLQPPQPSQWHDHHPECMYVTPKMRERPHAEVLLTSAKNPAVPQLQADRASARGADRKVTKHAVCSCSRIPSHVRF